jgi:hypothetical protein
MNHKNVIGIIAVVFITACNSSKSAETVNDTGATNLNAIITELPDKPGYASFKQNCMSCHSARYIQMQPELPEKTWTAIVTKMQKSYGAPVADSSVKEIVQYLVSIKGKG